MLRQIGTVPPDSDTCFHDPLTGTTLACSQGALLRLAPDNHPQPVHLPLARPTHCAHPRDYLPQLVRIEGAVVFNTERTIATNDGTSACIVRRSVCLQEGACWQFHVAGSLHGVELGVCQVSPNGAFKYLPFSFNASTARTVTFVLDDGEVRAWVNDSQPKKNNSKTLEWALNYCYPYIKLPSRGFTAIYNPFCSQPNTKITPSNPFNTHAHALSAKNLVSVQHVDIPNAKITTLKQIGHDSLLLVADNSQVKVIRRNPDNNLFQFPSVRVHGDVVYGLFTHEEWNVVTSVVVQAALGQIEWGEKGYNLASTLQLLKDLIIHVDSAEDHPKQHYFAVKYLLLTKLAVLRPYAHESIPNGITWCEIDRQLHQISQHYFKTVDSTPIRTIPAAVVHNSLPWFSLEGTFVDATSNYVLSVNKQKETSSYDLNVYHFNELGFERVFHGQLVDNKLEFSKKSMIKSFGDAETNYWKDNAQGAEIYKILSGCFAQPTTDSTVFQPQEKDLHELIQVFKIDKQDAVNALEQTGNIQDALAWLADSNRQSLRRRKLPPSQLIPHPDPQISTKYSILELSGSNFAARLLLHIHNSIYILGFDPKTLNTCYVQKTDKGFLNLFTGEYSPNIHQFTSDFMHQGCNHAQLSVLDWVEMAGTGEVLFKEGEGVYLLVGEDGKWGRVEVQVKEELVYRELNAIVLGDRSQCPDLQGQKVQSIVRTPYGELIPTLTRLHTATVTQPYSFCVSGTAYTSLPAPGDATSITDLWLHTTQPLTLPFNQQQPSECSYLPLLVESGPPGCNLHYPICSILYPRAPLPFLANYPYSLILRHLHGRCMRVSEIVIQRIGAKHNVNEIKQGYVYFVDEANRSSCRYHFVFEGKNQLSVPIGEQGYWRYMVIEPVYNANNKLPYEIGFVGARGTAIDLDDYEQALTEVLEHSIELKNGDNKAKFQISSLSHLSHSCYHIGLEHAPTHNPTPHSTNNSLTILMTRCRLHPRPQHPHPTPSTLAQLPPTQLMHHLTHGSSVGRVLAELGRDGATDLNKFTDEQVRILVDLFVSADAMSQKQWVRLYERLCRDSPAAAKYLQQITSDIGKGANAIISSKFMPYMLTTASASTCHQIVQDLLVNIDQLRDSRYKIVQGQYNCPYLLLQTHYYSHYYYEQVRALQQGNKTSIHCQPIFRQPLCEYKFATVKESRVRKIIVKLSHKYSIRNIVLRVDKSESVARAAVNVYAWEGQAKGLATRCLLHQHQWIQLAKNPYRKEMLAMFTTNQAWLNAYGVSFDARVQASYLQIEVLLSLNASGTGQPANQGLIEIIPEIYGQVAGSSQPVPQLQDLYFKFSQQQRILLSSLASRLQIDPDTSSPGQHNQLLNKYLINKHNMVQYCLYESVASAQSDSKLHCDEQALEFINEISKLMTVTSGKGHGVEIRKHRSEDITPLVQKYHQIMRNVAEGGSHVRLSRKVSLDYCYTVLMWVLDLYAKRQMVLDAPIASQLLQTIVKKQVGPVTLACLKAIFNHPDLLLAALQFIDVVGQDEDGPANCIYASALKGYSLLNVTDESIKKIVEANDTRLAESLLNIIIEGGRKDETSLRHVLWLAAQQNKHEKILKYILEVNAKGDGERRLFNHKKQGVSTMILSYLFDKSVPQKARNQLFIAQLSCAQLQGLIITAKKVLNLDIDYSGLLNRFLNDRRLKQVSLDVVSIIFELNLPIDEQWDLLHKCVRLCRTAEDMIHFQYLSASREQKDDLIQLATFHKDILHSAAKLHKNSELLANFLGEIYACSKRLFIETALSFPEIDSLELHDDIYPLIFRILEQECNLGGIEGAKLATPEENTWLSASLKLLKICRTNLDDKSVNSSEVQSLVKWYLLNNEYEEHMSNPVNRSPAVQNMKAIAQRIRDIIQKIGGARNINNIFSLYSEIKADIKKDSKRLLCTKDLILNRLQHGVCKLMQNDLSPQSLTEVLIGSKEKQGLTQEIINQLQEQSARDSRNQSQQIQELREADLTEQLQAYLVQGNKLVLNPCKELQSYKSGSKSHALSIAASSRRLFLKPSTSIAMTKFVIGFNVQQNNQRNIILPDAVQLYGATIDNIDDALSTSMRKICDLHAIDDQHFTQYGVRLFGINFDNIRRHYRNNNYNLLQVRVRSFGTASASDVLESNQKVTKNLVHNVSFVTIGGYREYAKTELSFSNIYMKILTFLKDPKYESTLKEFIKYAEKNAGVLEKFLGLLSIKSTKPGANKEDIESLLVALSRNNVKVLQFLLKEAEVNQLLVNKILKSNLTVPNVDIVLQKTLSTTLKSETVDNIIENINILNFNNSVQSSTFKLQGIIAICDRYEQLVRSQESNQKSQAPLLKKLLTCLTTCSNIFKISHIELAENLMAVEKSSTFYSIVSGFICASNQTLDWLLTSGKLDQISALLLSLMSECKTAKTSQLQSSIAGAISLISSVAVHQPIRSRLFLNPDRPELSRLPIKALSLLTNPDTLLEQYPVATLHKFINLFQFTCSYSSSQTEDSCSLQFAQKLIETMVRLPQTAPQYHNHFIHEFFFPIINAYNGVLVSFVWRGVRGEFLAKPTEVLHKLPIRKNNTVVEYDGVYYKLINNADALCSAYDKVIVYNGAVIASGVGGGWKLVDGGSSHQIRQIIQEKSVVRLYLNSSTVVELNPADSQSVYKCYQAEADIVPELSKLLTNQTLLRIASPTIFGKKYRTNLAITQGMLPNLYLLPIEMSFGDMLKQVYICGYVLSKESREGIRASLLREGSAVTTTDSFRDILGKIKSGKPVVQIQINAYQLFKLTSIEKIARQSLQTQAPRFIAQETIFKAFQKLQGLSKMIKVIIACVKNWNNQQQSKAWSQYLSELSSFSCFPIFSSIYMNKQENVQLLFNLLMGLPDKQDNAKWLQQEKKSVKFLYDIIKNVFEVEGEQAIIIRQYAVKSGFYETMLERLHLISKEPKRTRVEEDKQEEEEVEAPSELVKRASEDEFKKQIKKKKGIGYGNDSSTNQKWDITGHEEAKKEVEEQIIGLLKILEKFFSYPQFKLPKQYLNSSYESALLPILQASLRAGSLLQISKKADLFKQQLNFIGAIARNQLLVPILLQIPKIYEPKQPQSLYSLLTTLESTSKIFLSCLNKQVSEKTSEQIAKKIIETYNIVEEAVSNYKSFNIDEEADRKILELPLTKKYPILMKDLRFDYIDMKDKNGKIKHHYSSSYQAKHTPPPTKSIRLAQQLADISQALPIEHTNAIFVRCDKDRVDFMQALIMGSNGTPYGHGAYLFDIHFEDSYPNNPPKVNLTTTGSGSIRFNPNLYSCGKVCLSLLGTWRGSAMENWDAKVSTLLQVLVSIQSIIMAEEIYFNEPGFEHEQGTVEGEKKNEAYSNIVRYGNIKFAMIENIRNPPKGFETIIKRHFYLKKDQILKECNKWLKFAEKREASYTGLVSDHNNNWCNTFKKSKTEYKTMLEKAIKELEIELNNLPEPSAKDLIKQNKTAKKDKKKKQQAKPDKQQVMEQIDVTYDVKAPNEISTNYKQMDINDEKVKDRWSRYIGAMGLEAVSKQSKANILLFGLSGLGIEIAKNIVMSGCKKFTVCDDELTTWSDLSGQFYLTQQDVGKSRVSSCLYKLQQLNNYVRVNSTTIDITKLEEDKKLSGYQVVITTVHNDNEIIVLDNYCRANDIKLIVAKTEGPYGYVFNDFGAKMEVLDKNGEETVECFIEGISNSEQGLVTLMKGQKHPYQDGDVVVITKVKGMDGKDEAQKSINGSLHKVKVINQNSFKIGDTTGYTQYEGNGLVKNVKIPIEVNFKSFQESIKLTNIDNNLAFYDFAKSTHNEALHACFRALGVYKSKNQNKYPGNWNWSDAQNFIQIYKQIKKGDKQEQYQLQDKQKAYVLKFSFTCAGSFAPLSAFYGGLVAQEAFKAITNKYMPINQFFLTDFTEVIDDLPKQLSEWQDYVAKNKQYKPQQDRFEGLRSIVGEQTLQKIRDCKVFVVGSGAIGCQLLKNYAMINLATSEKPDKGTIVITDPDHIETSNLNRQFLFREKHLQKPKSATAAAVVKQMNKYLKPENKIKAKLIKVCEATKDTFSNEFLQSMDIVTNALDNVQARQYVDLRCVESKVALLQSGTLSTKGHVQVIIPYKTQTYGNKADPAEEGDIPHCTLKMFPEETLHCVEWARDIFGKTFTLRPKALAKVLESLQTYSPTSSETGVLKQCLELLQYRPSTFDDAVLFAVQQFYKLYRNDIKQLLYTYPLDAKTKDGKDFWKLPKRPPTPIQQINPEIKLHGEFITSFAVLLCKIYGVPYPKDFRTDERRQQIVKDAAKIKVPPFVPSDKLAKQMASEVEQNKDKKETEEVSKQKQQIVDNAEDEVTLFKKIKQQAEISKQDGVELKVTAQEFEKDQDSNGHIDLIYSMANLRAMNYSLEPMDWITTKLKAGRITPALSTTTSCIAALQTIELIKYLKSLPIDQMKNTFLNLAVPFMQAGEPGEVEKIKIHDKLTTNIWERWTLDQVDICEVTMGRLIALIEQKYGVKVKILNIAGAGPIYSQFVLGLDSKKQQKQNFLKRTVKQVLSEEVAAEDLKTFIDLTLVMAVGDEIVKHVPTLRVNFTK